MSLKNFGCFFIVSVFVLSAGCSFASDSQDTAEDFELKSLTNKIVTLSQYKDKKPVILLFWTTWCPFCLKEMKSLNKTDSKLSEDGWEILAVDVNEPLYKVENFIQKNGFKFTVLLDKDGSVSNSYGIISLPTYVMVTKTGAILFKANYFPHQEYEELTKKAQGQ